MTETTTATQLVEALADLGMSASSAEDRAARNARWEAESIADRPWQWTCDHCDKLGLARTENLAWSAASRHLGAVERAGGDWMQCNPSVEAR